MKSLWQTEQPCIAKVKQLKKAVQLVWLFVASNVTALTNAAFDPHFSVAWRLQASAGGNYKGSSV